MKLEQKLKQFQPHPSSVKDTAARRAMPQDRDKALHALGSMMWLLQHSPLHQKYTVRLLLSRILPPMAVDQFRMFYKGALKRLCFLG